MASAFIHVCKYKLFCKLCEFAHNRSILKPAREDHTWTCESAKLMLSTMKYQSENIISVNKKLIYIDFSTYPIINYKRFERIYGLGSFSTVLESASKELCAYRCPLTEYPTV